ncbi:hypothetical protein BGX31_002064 [Mortierella sp. GBA43]|nr:hypothetical protein BGX31_002064 [Mortierella sp. GBA43]
MAMCTTSCQGYDNIQDNSCNVETLEWSCVCAAGASKIYNDWQFPIPFKLCRMNQLTCLHACPKLDQNALGQDVTGGISNVRGSRLQQQQQSRVSFPFEASDHIEHDDDDDFDQDDYDAIDEFLRLQHHSRLEEGAYSRFEKEGQQESAVNKKKKQLHKKLWALQRNELEDNGDFITLSDPTAHRDPTCVLRCQGKLACGTKAAPAYRGIVQIPSEH